MHKLIFTFLILFCAGLLQAQPKYWIFLNDKAGVTSPAVSEKTLQNRLQQGLAVDQFSDLAISKAYLDSLQAREVKVVCHSRWLNAVSALLDAEQLQQLSNASFVKEIRPIDTKVTFASKSGQSGGLHATLATVPVSNKATGFASGQGSKVYPEYLGMALSQIEASSFIEMGISGKGTVIGVIDAGYYEAHLTPNLKHLFTGNKILGFKDFVNPANPLAFEEQETMLDFHGTTVLGMIAGYDSTSKTQFGLAHEASFYLARTDHGKKEFRGEEDYWVAALEWMDSLGVRLINTSLGYALGFDDPTENYHPEQMDGKSSVIARAAQIAAEEKGILIVVSAGNDGDNPYWHVISTPADAPGVMAVGATPEGHRERISYSGIGPEFLSYLKPNVSCFSLTGTSFSAPVITGLAACLMQLNPTLTNKELIQVIEQSGHLYPFGNNYLGYGVPNAYKAIKLATGDSLEVGANAGELKVQGVKVKLPVTANHWPVVVFHKKNATIVTRQERLKIRRKHVEVNRPLGVVRTTVDLGDKVLEIIWE